MAERQFGPYKLVRQIAVGGMAEIHLAKAAGIAGFEKYVALKMIHPNFAEDEQFIQMLVDEAKIAVQLTHGNIAQTFDLGRVGETYYITMEYVDGADLYKILRRASEQDLDMPLDVCAFLAKEVSSALDHAHRKRDHAGKSLGIVHRDVSPQNVLVSYSGEVKLVDFGIAKATMKVRQTAVGVIKGKYYYMSPEQAWGDPIDHRSDIFSAGIVLYEMITGQMMYLEEDLHKLLEMARKAEIPPPSKLRKGVPPQLERIVMHALAKQPGERYQSAGDLATDLERFLHAYSPVFTASKLSTLVRQVVGEPIQVPDDLGLPSIEYRDGVMSTHPLDDSEVAHAIDAEDLRDENSVLFRVAELDRPGAKDAAAGGRPAQATGQAPGQRSTPPPARPSTPPPVPSAVRPSVPRVTRATDQMPALPSVPRSSARRDGSTPPPSGAAPGAGGAAPRLPARTPPAGRPRQAHEETRQLDQPAPPDPLRDDSGLLTPAGQKLSWIESDRSATADDLDNIGERTVVTGAPGMGGPPVLGFMMDGTGDDPIEATLVTAAPTGFGLDPGQDSTAGPAPDPAAGSDAGSLRDHDDDDEDGPTLSRDFSRDHPTKPARRALKAPPPAALAAKIHAPAVSELRKPRPSRRTPPGGMPAGSANVLQAIVASKSSEPMPVPRPTPPPAAIQATVAMPSTPPGMAPFGMGHPGAAQGALQQHGAMAPPGAMPPGMHAQTHPYGAPPFPVGTPGAQQSYNHDASGMPLGIPTPPGVTLPSASGHYQVPGQVPGHVHGQHPGVGAIPGVHPDYLAQPPALSAAGYPQLPSHALPMSPNALYGLQAPPQPASLTGQLRWSEIDEIPSQYKLGAARRRWFTYIVSGLIAVSVAAGVTFLIIRLTREATPTTGSVHVVSVPAGADVSFDGTLLADRTPVTIDGAPVGTRHKIVVALRHYQPYTEEVAIPKIGGPVQVMAQLTSQTGKIVINTTPGGAQIWINGQPRGTTPTTLTGIDIDSTPQIELLHKDFGRQAVPLRWDAAGTAYVDYRFSH